MSTSTLDYYILRDDTAPGGRFPIDDPAQMWSVVKGEVDLFASFTGPGGEPGALHFVLRRNKGEAIFGIDLNEFPGLTLVARCGPDTEVEVLKLAYLRARAVRVRANHDVLRQVEDWVEALSRAVSGSVAPKNFTPIVPGKDLEIGDKPQVILAGRHPVWVRHRLGSSRFLARPEGAPVNGCGYYPVSSSGWIEAQPNSRIFAIESHEWLAEDEEFAALRAFHRTILLCLVPNLKDTDARERRRLQAKAETDVASVATALRELSVPLAGGDGLAVRRDARSNPLMAVCEAVAKAQGIAVKPHPDMLRGIDVHDPVLAIADASDVRVRRVALKGRWWLTEGGPMVAFREAGHTPVALLPKGSRYLLYDPADERTSRVDEKTAAALSGFAFAFYRGFPAKAMSALDLVAFGVRGCGRELAIIAATGIAAALLAMLTPAVTGMVFDLYIPGARRMELLMACGFLAIGGLVAGLFNLCSSFALLRLEGRMDAAIGGAVWDRLLSLPIPFFSRFAAGELAARSMAISTMREVLTGTTLSATLSGIFSLFSAALMFYYSWQLSMVAIVLAAIAFAVSFGTNYFELRYARRTLAIQGRIAGMLLELLSSIAKFRVSGTEKRAFTRWVREFAEQKKLDLKGEYIANVYTIFMAVYPVLSLVVIYYTNARLTGGGDSVGLAPALTTGQFLAFTAAFNQLLSAVLNISTGMMSLLSIVPLYERAAPILRTLPESNAARSAPGALAGGIEISRVIFRYRPDAPLILRDVSISIQPGQFVALVGPSGSGKSTLLRLLLGFETPESGAIYFDGQDLAGLDVRAVRRQIGVVMQNGALMNGSILHNIVGNSALTIDDAWEAAALAGVEKDIRALPMGMYTHLSQNGGGMSGGQKQRIMIARAIVNRPRIVLFDEATSALDNHTQAIVSESLKSLKATRIVIAHRLSTVLDADRICVLDGGRIVQSGNYRELMEQGGLFAELARRQIA